MECGENTWEKICFWSSQHLFLGILHLVYLDIEAPPVLMLSFVLSLLRSPSSCLIPSPFSLFAEDEVKYWGRRFTHLLSTTAAAASWTCIIEHAAAWPKGKTPGQSHKICCSGQAIFKSGSGQFWELHAEHYHLLIISEWIPSAF